MQFEISLTIKGGGYQNILNNSFYLDPVEVMINGEINPSCKKSCLLVEAQNNVKIKFDHLIETCANMFDGLSNIIEIDLSNLDTSKVKNMSSMFNECVNLENIIFGNINTSSVENMFQLFQDCKKLTSINVSNFDTSCVVNMQLLDTVNLYYQ